MLPIAACTYLKVKKNKTRALNETQVRLSRKCFHIFKGKIFQFTFCSLFQFQWKGFFNMIFLLSVDFSNLVAFHIWLVHISETVSSDQLSSSLMFIVYLEKKWKLFTWKLRNILILTSFNERNWKNCHDNLNAILQIVRLISNYT